MRRLVMKADTTTLGESRGIGRTLYLIQYSQGQEILLSQIQRQQFADLFCSYFMIYFDQWLFAVASEVPTFCTRFFITKITLTDYVIFLNIYPNHITNIHVHSHVHGESGSCTKNLLYCTQGILRSYTKQ